MRIATKLNSGLFLVLAASAAANSVALNTAVTPRFEEIETTLAHARHERISNAIEALIDPVRGAAQDYAFWDDTRAFALGTDGGTFVQENFAPASITLQGLSVNGFVIRGLDGRVLLEEGYDLETKERAPDLARELAELGLSHPLLTGGAESNAVTGLVGSSKGPLLVAIAPILKSDRSGTAAGTVTVARKLDVQSAIRLTGVSFALDPVEGPATEEGGKTVAQVLPDKIETTSLVRDILGRPLGIVRASSPRDASRIGLAAVHTAALLMLGSAAAAGVALWLLTRRIVVERIVALSDHFVTAGSTGRIREARPDPSGDEIGQLARAYDGMAARVNALQDALADIAYKAGLSEWASGTLHNVRNGLTPVEIHSWEIRNTLDPAWLAKLERVVAELRTADASDERRADLVAYLEASALRTTEAGRKIHGLTSRIGEANRAVVDIVAQFEEYVRRDMRVEPVDVAALVAEVAREPQINGRADVEIVLPERPAVALTNRIILRQIVGNVLMNAAEAIEASGRRGIVRMAAEHEPGGTVTISIADNGEGMDRQRLATLFQLGVSSRTGKRGGLGLHWCANAMKLLGGAIRAESGGPGEGALFVLTLPCAPAGQLREAA